MWLKHSKMASSEFSDEFSVDIELSNYELEVEGDRRWRRSSTSQLAIDDDDIISLYKNYLDKFACSEDPLADEDWVAEYNRLVKETRARRTASKDLTAQPQRVNVLISGKPC